MISDREVAHETGANVILVLREGNEPIYIATDTSNDRIGE
jgi:protein tyrosine/serine phosphatase